MIGNMTRKSALRGSPQVSKTNRVIAPVKGIDSRNMLSTEDPMYSIYSFNLIPSQYGLQVREGYREWSVGLETAPDMGLGVSTIIPSGGTDSDASDDRLWAVTNEGIWNATTYNAVPTLDLDFLDFTPAQTDASAGWGVYTQYTTDAADKLLFYADSANGLFVYDGTVWARPAITGNNPSGANLDIENVVFVTSHKASLWLFEAGSTVAWYLPEGAVLGAATPFYFGSKFKNGGELAGIFSWSIDGGAGIDDLLVAVSRSGDVIIYEGQSPDDADFWRTTGQWFIGAIPEGSKFADSGGGDLYILSSYGLLSLGDLVKSVDGADAQLLTEANKIAPVISTAMNQYRLDNGWQVTLLPSAGRLAVGAPVKNNGEYNQYSQSLYNGGWGITTGVPTQSFDEWSGSTYIGTPDNRVCILDSVRDNVTIIPPEGRENGDRIPFSILTDYSTLGEPAVFKRGKFLRADFIGSNPPIQTSKFLYDSDLNTITNTNNANPISADGTWVDEGAPGADPSLWDAAIWASGVPTASNYLVGGMGMGRTVAIACTGTADSNVTLISWDVVWDSGSPL